MAARADPIAAGRRDAGIAAIRGALAVASWVLIAPRSPMVIATAESPSGRLTASAISCLAAAIAASATKTALEIAARCMSFLALSSISATSALSWPVGATLPPPLPAEAMLLACITAGITRDLKHKRLIE